MKVFLQGYLTCNSDRIEKNTPTPMTLCNLKGRVIANGWALGDDEQVMLVVHRSLAAAVATFLKPYAMFSKIQIQVETEAIGVTQVAEVGGEFCRPFCGDWALAPGLLTPDSAADKDQSIAIDQGLTNGHGLVFAGGAVWSQYVGGEGPMTTKRAAKLTAGFCSLGDAYGFCFYLNLDF